MRNHLPAALLALFAGWAGTLYYGASAGAVAVGHLALLGAVAWGWQGWDPLRLGPRARALPPLMWLWLLVSMRASAVPRAAWLAVSLLPAFMALPAVVARCWAGAADRRRGVLAVCVVAGGIGAIGLAGMAWQGSPRAAQPLGNAVVLGVVLATLAPLALVEAVAAMRTPGGATTWRATAVAAVALVGGGIVATRSLGALAAALAGTALVLPRGRRRWLLVPLLAGGLLLAPRLARLAAGEDLSIQARWAYWRGGVAGLARRPLLGWGPGATAWTLAPLLRPVPGVNPPGEVVADTHSLPVQLAFELGLPGLVAALAVGLAFVRARRRELPAEDGGGLRRAGLAGLASGVAALTVGPTLGTTAPWVALAIAAGAALAGSTPTAVSDSAAAQGPPPARPGRGPRVGSLYAAVALLLLAPLDIALGCYDAARVAPPARAAELLGVAVELDPDMPLYRARLGWLAPTASARATALARAAAGAPGVPALQLAAGWALEVAGADGTAELSRACAGDPLAGPAPFLLATRPAAGNAAGGAAGLAARALLNDPPLAAAVAWEHRPELLAAGLRQAARWDGVDAGLRQALIDVAGSLTHRGSLGALRVTMDEQPSTALSLHAFRRLPWPATLAVVPVRSAEARLLSGLPAAGSLRATRADAFAAPCLPRSPR